jgi:hypothetical protein
MGIGSVNELLIGRVPIFEAAWARFFRVSHKMGGKNTVVGLPGYALRSLDMHC